MSIDSQPRHNQLTVENIQSDGKKLDKNKRVLVSNDNLSNPNKNILPFFNRNHHQTIRDSEEIQHLSQEIKQTAKKPENKVNTTLFPDRPSLYEQHHQQFKKEKKTLKGFIRRKIDIQKIKQQGIDNASKVYDDLRSRGLNRQQILAESQIKHVINFEGELKPCNFNINKLFNSASKVVDRLHSLGYGNYPDEFNLSVIDSFSGFCQLSDEQFQQRRRQVQPFVFLSHHDINGIMTQSPSDSKVNIVIEHLSKNILNQQDKNFDSFRSYLLKILTSDSITQDDILQYYKIMVPSDINPEKPIIISQELTHQYPDHQDKGEIIKYLTGIKDRQQQKFLLNFFEKNCRSSNTSLDSLFQSGFPTVDFYKKYTSSIYYQKEKISIPDSTLNLIEDPKIKTFYQNVSNISNPEIQETCFDVDIKDTIPEYFDKNGKPSGYLLFSYLKNADFLDNGQLPDIESEHLARLSVEDQNKLKFTKFVRKFILDSKVDVTPYSLLSDHFLINFNSVSDYMNDKGQPSSSFYKTLFRELNHLLDEKTTEYVFDAITPDVIDTFEPTDKLFWKGLLSLKNVNKNSLAVICQPDHEEIRYFNQDGLPTSRLFTNLGQRGYLNQEFLSTNLTHQVIDTFDTKDQQFWKGILSLKNLEPSHLGAILIHKSSQNESINEDLLPTSHLFYSLFAQKVLKKSFLESNLTAETLDGFSYEQQKLWKFISSQDDIIDNHPMLSFLYYHQDQIDDFIDNNQLTKEFYQQYALTNPENFIRSSNKETWRKTFGKDVLSSLLNSLPKANQEKRNAFTNNQYDRTSQFFTELVNNQKLQFQLDSENITIATEYIKNYGLAKNSEFFYYFQLLSKHQQDLSTTLPSELVENQIDSIEKLNQEIKKIQKICFSQESLTDLSEITSFQQILISIITGHSTNRFSRVPIETIMADFSHDIHAGDISPTPKEFHPKIIKLSLTETKSEQKIDDNPRLMTIKQEILSAIDYPENISTEKAKLLSLFEQKVISLETKMSEKNNQEESKKQEYLKIQLESIKNQIDLLSEVSSIDDLLTSLITFNLALGSNQEEYNSILRQLVFKKVFIKHQGSQNMTENLKMTLESDNTVLAVNNTLDFLNNTVKDHALNFETNNQDNYWEESTFNIMKKYSSVFKKNLSLSIYVKETESLRKSFITTNLGQDENIAIIPDCGLIGEMSGYMADVCYTSVYPLLKQFPDLVPHKFISNPNSENPSFIGSALVFRIKGGDDQPTFLIRAFDIPQEQSYDIGQLFESYADYLSSVAKNVGVKKIITAGTSGTISNYNNTIDYVTSKYVKDKEYFPLAQKFNFNGYDITDKCYLVRDISGAEMPGNEPRSESRQ